MRGVKKEKKKENDEDSRPFARRSLLGISSLSGELSRSLGSSALIITRSTLLIARASRSRHGNVPRFRFHPITPVCSHPPFSPPTKAWRWAASRWPSNLRLPKRGSSTKHDNGRYFTILLSKTQSASKYLFHVDARYTHFQYQNRLHNQSCDGGFGSVILPVFCVFHMLIVCICKYTIT